MMNGNASSDGKGKETSSGTKIGLSSDSRIRKLGATKRQEEESS